MPTNNDDSEPRAVAATPDDTPKKRAAKSAPKSTVKAPAKASARTKATPKAAASEASEQVVSRSRRKAAAPPSVEPTASKPAPRVRRAKVTNDVAASAPAELSAEAPAIVDAPDVIALSDSTPAQRFDEDEVRVRAYMLSLARGDSPGSPDSDWYQAEREVALSRQL